MSAKPAGEPLRILAVINLPWDPRLGAARVWIELAAEWRTAGHHVEKFCLTDAFDGAQTSAPRTALRMLLFPFRARAFVRRHGARFDVIDALVSTLPFRKKSLRFRGLIVTRSVGLYHLYDRFEAVARRRWPTNSKGKISGRIFYRFFNWRMRQTSRASLAHCDLLNVPNSEELKCVREEIHSTVPTIVQPYGLAPAHHQSYRQRAAAVEKRLANKKICFLGMWSARKGAKDWGEILRLIRNSVPSARFVFLGTMVDNAKVLHDLAVTTSEFVEIVSEFEPDELPDLLSDCTVAAFPSYIEGFGLAVVEQLASGIPTVCYDAPGPRDILRNRLPELLVSAGDVEQFSRKIAEILTSDLPHYADLCARSTKTAAAFSWPKIAEDTVAEYRDHLRRITASDSPLV